METGGRKGIFITLEGIEGSGKTTQLPHITTFLNERGFGVTTTREPGGTAIGAKVRAILLDPENRGLAPLAELFLYEADRAQHIEEKIAPALARGQAVVCDRFYDATTVYQGAARGLDAERIAGLHAWIANGYSPDITLLFDLPAREGLSRARARLAAEPGGQKEGRFEEEDLAFHERVREGYLALSRREPRRFRVIDATGSYETVRERAVAALAAYLDERK